MVYNKNMSVTIRVESVGAGAFEFDCYDYEMTLGPYDTVEETRAAILEHYDVCDFCAAYKTTDPRQILDVDEFVNMSNENAAVVFNALGVPLSPDGESYNGTISAVDLLSASLLALASERSVDSVSSAGIATEQGNFTNYSIDGEYVNKRLGELADLATVAYRLDRNIVWE